MPPDPARLDAPPPAAPLVVLTGFLGAGKTTVINRVLSAQHHRRVAVLVNELGQIDIDAGLVRGRAGDVMELAGGCVCHQMGVRRELFAALGDVLVRSRPDVLVLETTGIAEPSAVLAGLRDDDPGATPGEQIWGGPRPRTSRPLIERVTVVTVVDAEAALDQLDRHAEAREQVELADRILLSKLDLAPPATLARLHDRLAALNAIAERAAFPPTDAGAAALVPWLLDGPFRGLRDEARQPGAGAGAHAHGHQITAATFVDPAPLLPDALLMVCEALGDRLLRAKGYVQLWNEPRRGFLERAGRRTELRLGEPWGADPRETRLVLIGEGLDQAAIQRRLWACRAPDDAR